MISVVNIFGRYLTLCAIAAVLGAPFDRANANNFKVLHSFCADNECSDGARVQSGVIRDNAGNLYGTTTEGSGTDCGGGGCGIVFKLAPDGTETVLHSFLDGSDGGHPVAGVIMDTLGNLYGTTYFGGGTNCVGDGCGTVFRIAPDGTETVLYSFENGGGANPYAGVIMDKKGNLYGTTFHGGTDGVGTVFKLAPDGTETVLHSFLGGSDGANPYAGVIMDRMGNLYGTTILGGPNDRGIVFKLATDGSLTVLHEFTYTDGADPEGDLIMDKNGNLFGTTYAGGASGNGTVFKLAPDGTETVLHSFNVADGANPEAGVIMVKSGNFYGTTYDGGKFGYGTVFKLKPDGTETVLRSFNGVHSGDLPWGGLIEHKGELYGTTFGDGLYSFGTVFKLKD